MTKNNRKFTRIPFERQVTLDFFTQAFDDCQVIDLNLTGMFILGDYPQELGENCLIKMSQKGGDSYLSLRAAAKVVRVTEEGVGIEFTAMTFECYMFLQTTLLYECTEPCHIALEIPENCPFDIIDELPLLPGKGYASHSAAA